MKSSTVLTEKGRPHCDLDLLVREEDFINASGLLEELGYKSKIRRFCHLKGVDCEEAFIHQRDPDKNIMVELHWDLHKIILLPACYT